MSSMRNAVQRRNHKERAQPRERERWGLLEKHKDYSLRAKDYNAKKKQLKNLRQKAAERNPDEFHFGMMSHRIQDGGTKTSKRSEYASMPHATAQLLKTQDAGYLRTVIQSTRKARQRLREELVLQQTQDGMRVSGTPEYDEDGLDALVGTGGAAAQGAQRRHVVFVDDRAEQQAYDASKKDHANQLDRVGRPRGVHVDDEDWELSKDEKAAAAKQRPRRKELAALAADDPAMRQKSMAAMERRLEATREREKALVAAELELELQRARMSNSIGGVTKAGHKFRIKERKR